MHRAHRLRLHRRRRLRRLDLGRPSIVDRGPDRLLRGSSPACRLCRARLRARARCRRSARVRWRESLGSLSGHRAHARLRHRHDGAADDRTLVHGSHRRRSVRWSVHPASLTVRVRRRAHLRALTVRALTGGLQRLVGQRERRRIRRVEVPPLGRHADKARGLHRRLEPPGLDATLSLERTIAVRSLGEVVERRG